MGRLPGGGLDVPGNSQSQLTIEWAAINKDHSANTNTVRDAIDAAATAYAKQQQQQGQQKGLLDVIVAGVKSVVPWVTQDCDTGLFHQKVTIDGATLSNLAGYDDGKSSRKTLQPNGFLFLTIRTSNLPVKLVTTI